MKPQDILILLKLIVIGKQRWVYDDLASELFMSKSEVHAGIGRATEARLIDLQISRQPLRRAFLEFLIHGVKYVYPPKRGTDILGIPTAYAAPPLSKLVPVRNPPPVWPSSSGWVKGFQFSPLYKSVPQAAMRDSRLYELLTLLDAIRDNHAKEQQLAAKELTARIYR
jgi:hypothetical protein